MVILEGILEAISVITFFVIFWVVCLTVYENTPDAIRNTCGIIWRSIIAHLFIAFMLTGLGWAVYNLMKYLF